MTGAMSPEAQPPTPPRRPARGAPESAPFRADVADAPAEAAAFWVTTPSGTRVRIARLAQGERGTVLVFPGRTEFVEKYGRAAAALKARGYGTACLDWRGQGMSDRPLSDPATGHVDSFEEYQEEVGALLGALPALGLEGPLHLIGHSMGGGIGLRAVLSGLPVRSAAFTGPMWGIALSPFWRPSARAVSAAGRFFGLGARYAPGHTPESYVKVAVFEDNTLTADPEMFAWMQGQLRRYPELALGGPSLAWVNEALTEIAALKRLASPDLPCLTVLGSEESIIDTVAVRERMARWPNGTLQVVPGARHEIMMEIAEVREAFFDAACALFDGATAA